MTHAYSRANQGDGLLVDETLALLREVIPEEPQHVVGALHAETFIDLPAVAQVPAINSIWWMKEATDVARAMAMVGVHGHMRFPLYDQFLGKVKMVVGVGGGYLRSGTCVEAAKTGIAHLSQLLWVARNNIPAFYMPQSVGPLRGPVGYGIRSALRKIDCLCLRDDRSVAEVGASATTLRLPDLAIMELYRRFDRIEKPRTLPKIYLIARDLERPPWIRAGYISRLQKLRHLLPNIEVITQSTRRGNDDTAFYRAMGWGSTFRSARDVVLARDYGVVIAVRLHGALQALLGGFPAVHLTYERKGFGAYQDLGVPDYVHLSTHFDPDGVALQARSLQADSWPFWERLSINAPVVAQQMQRLKEMLRQVYSRCSAASMTN